MSTNKPREELLEKDKRLKDEVEKKHGKTVEQLYAEREKRLYDAVQLKVPDRVPVIFGGTFFALKYAGLPYSTAYYDAAAWKQAYKKTMLDLEPDAYGVAMTQSGRALENLESDYNRWPGYNLPDNVAQQVLEQEFMKADEYDLFLSDPSDFIIRVWLPRVFGVLEPLAKLPPLMSMGTNLAPITTLFASPAFEQLARAMKKAGQEEMKWRQTIGEFDKEMASLGFPQALPAWGGVQPPFSGFTNNFRTWKGIVLDMFRQPDKLLAALEKLLEWRISRATPAVRKEGRPTMASSSEPHRVSDELMSLKQFDTFVWPNWKRAVEATFNLGYDVISMFFEGRRDKQLEHFLDFPKGSLMIRFAETDIFRAKEMFAGRACLMGNVPIAMLVTGSTQDVEEYCKKLITVCGKDGGFILRCSTDYTQEAKPENAKAMIDTVKKYGQY
ncbi:uroporphyrinogen decarboxylase family protein [Chloroflexota bacterium]